MSDALEKAVKNISELIFLPDGRPRDIIALPKGPAKAMIYANLQECISSERNAEAIAALERVKELVEVRKRVIEICQEAAKNGGFSQEYQDGGCEAMKEAVKIIDTELTTMREGKE